MTDKPYETGFLEEIINCHFGDGDYYVVWHMSGTRVTGAVTAQMLGGSKLLKTFLKNTLNGAYGPDAHGNSDSGEAVFDGAVLVKCSPNSGSTPVFNLGVTTSPVNETIGATVIGWIRPDDAALDANGNHWWKVDSEVFAPVFDEVISMNPAWIPTVNNGGRMPLALYYTDPSGSTAIWDTAYATTYTIHDHGNYWLGLGGYGTATGEVTMVCSPATPFDNVYLTTITELPAPAHAVTVPDVVPYHDEDVVKQRLVTMGCSVYSTLQFKKGVVPTLDSNGFITPTPTGEPVFGWSMRTQVGDDIATFNGTCGIHLKTRTPTKEQLAFAASISEFGAAKPTVLMWPSGGSGNDYFPVGLGSYLPFGTKPPEPYPWP